MLRAEKEYQREKEKQLVATGESIRDMALKRSGGGAESEKYEGSTSKKRFK